MNRVVVIGLGIFGSNIVKELYENGFDVIAVDKDKDAVHRIKDFATKAIVANGGGVRERQEASEKISRTNSPAQLAGVIEGYQKLLAGQLESIGTQYKATTRRDDFDSRLSDRTRRVLGRGKSADGVDASNPLLQ